jgi:hypothetical protein
MDHSGGRCARLACWSMLCLCGVAAGQEAEDGGFPRAAEELNPLVPVRAVFRGEVRRA